MYYIPQIACVRIGEGTSKMGLVVNGSRDRMWPALYLVHVNNLPEALRNTERTFNDMRANDTMRWLTEFTHMIFTRIKRQGADV